MLQKKVLGTNANSSTVLVKDTAAGGELRVLKRINVSSWVDSDVEKALEMYNAIAASDIPHMVKIYTAVLQNTFLSIVSSYCPGEELQEYIEEKLTGPLDEVMALQWLWNVARVVQRVHSLPLCNRLLCFYGPLLDRIFVVEGGEDVVVGLPLPRVLYFKWLAERESFGVALHHEYPPEVLRGRCYYTPASDIWQLGLVGMRLLSANTSFDHRSPAACSLITSMMDPIMKKRPTIEEVISRLQDLLREGDVRSLSMPDIPNSPTSYDRFLTPKSMLMDERTAATSQEEEFECLTTDISKLNEDHIYGAQRRAWRTRVQPSWYRRAMRQFEELQIMNSSPLVSRSRPSSPIQSGSTIFSPRGIADRKVATARDMQSESRAFRRQAVPALALGRNTKPRVTERAPNSARRVPKSYTSPNDSLAASARRPQKQDFGEKKRRLQAMEREAYAMHRVHENRMREIRQSQDDVMKHDIRRYIKQWREQSSTVKDDSISFTEQDGVAIFFPKVSTSS
ncbi:unnamed protein product [Trypanosoma congolense IL3000]|uniref:WGS project CAEQ00000000 data, annotated contig 1128 n=1 Tax=Trypanosoma congolense (strain IL3000) TaxID=1068625 RepID=F9W3Y7_TRYCI|nr:unnamed protein product [Trypanosoma congolense IL3000]